jgi:hypothetical protein
MVINKVALVPMLLKYHSNLLKYLQFLGLKYQGKLPWNFSLSAWVYVIKHFDMVIYCHSMVINMVALVPMLLKYHNILLQYLQFLGLKCYGKLPQ